MTDIATAIAGRLDEVRSRIAAAAARAGRPGGAVRLVAVSKTYGADHVAAAVAAGQLDFGENKVQEGLQKIGEAADTTIRWHLIGHLQSNKARKAGEVFDWIHAVDSEALLRQARRRGGRGRTASPAAGPGGSGGRGHQARRAPEALAGIFAAAATCTAAELVGLMLLPPAVADPEEARPWFRRLRATRDGLAAAGVPAARLAELSMGMSHDFEVAVEEGATIVRVGSAIFGARG